MKKPWEVRYLHEKAIRDCFYQMHGEVPPEDNYGTLSPLPKRLMIRFEGKKFQELLKESGHTTALFETCSCHEEYVHLGGK